MDAMRFTKSTATPIPIAASLFLDTPRKLQIPRNLDNTKLLMSIALMNIISRFISWYLLSGLLLYLSQRSFFRFLAYHSPFHNFHSRVLLGELFLFLDFSYSGMP